jgi:hypothetical protein
MQPRAECTIAAKAGEALPGADERILRDVRRGLLISDQTEGHGVHARRVQAIQGFECGDVTALGAANRLELTRRFNDC